MVKVGYPGIGNAKAAFEELRPLRRKLIDMQTKYRPFHEDYLAIQEAMKALDKLAERFTGDSEFYSIKYGPSNDFKRG